MPVTSHPKKDFLALHRPETTRCPNRDLRRNYIIPEPMIKLIRGTMIKLTKKEIVEILKDRDGDRCFICSGPFALREYPTLDHWFPRSAGGSDHYSNLRLAHRRCNILKSDLIPNDDGTIPARERKIRPADRRQVKKELQGSVCHHCNNGRKLDKEQTCNNCGSMAGPIRAPHYLKRKSTSCDHNHFWCWACSIGIVERRSALMDLIIGES